MVQPKKSGDQVGAYRLLRRMDVVAAGEAWEAKDDNLDRRLLLRFPPEQVARDPEAMERFRRAVRNLARLDHPNVAQVHELGEHEGVAYSAHALEGERTLAEALEAGALPPDVVLRIGAG